LRLPLPASEVASWHNGRGIILRDRTGSDVGEGHLADMQIAAQNAAFEEGADAGGSEYMP